MKKSDNMKKRRKTTEKWLKVQLRKYWKKVTTWKKEGRTTKSDKKCNHEIMKKSEKNDNEIQGNKKKW